MTGPMHRAVAADICRWLAGREAEMVALLETLVNIDSGSGNVAGVAAVADVLQRFLEEHGVFVARVPAPDDAVILHASVLGGQTGKVLLMGHMDTVFPAGAAKLRPFAESGGRLTGPGVADMKAGLVMHCFVLAAFAQAGGGQRPVHALFTCDEEVASPLSRGAIAAAAADVAFALNAEPGRANGNVVIERKGGIFARIRAIGEAAHAGTSFESGASAIVALSHAVVDVAALTDLQAGLTANVGLVSGGVSVNTVPPHAEARIDIRLRTEAQRDAVLRELERIVGTPRVAGTTCSLEVLGEFEPMAPSASSRALLDLYRACAAEVGFAPQGEATGGCSDAGLVASLGVPVLCGVGPVGGHAHTEREYVERASLVPRAQAVALTALRGPGPAGAGVATGTELQADR